MSKNVREVALDTLVQIEKNQSYSNLLLNEMIEKNKLSSRDIGLLTEIVYGTIQRKLTLDYFLTPFIKQPHKLELWVRLLLHMSLYQIVFLDKIPERAAIYEAVQLAKKKGHKGIASLVNGVLRNAQRQGVPSLDQIADPLEKLAIATSHPVWLVEKWVKQYGLEETKRMCETNLLPPPLTARINITKATERNELIKQLKESGIEATAGDVAPEAVKITKGNVAHTSFYQEGYLTIQDESSMLVARALDVQKGQTILDSCAAPGGKTTHIAELLENSGNVLAVDLHSHKVRLIEKQVDRLGLQNVATKVMDSRELDKHFANETFERILVDAPCTGFGVLRRKPDIKYSKTKEDIHTLAQVQQQLLQTVAPLLKKGGLLVYSTCTVDKEENDHVIAAFLKANDDFEADETLANRLPEKLHPYIKKGAIQLLPQYFGTDGFYIAALRKKV